MLRRPGLVVVDLGVGERPVTTVELFQRLRRVNPDVRVIGLDISQERITEAARQASPGLEFGVGGFELGGHRPHVVRAFNVLRQYDADEVRPAWDCMQQRLASGGLILDGTCDEDGRLAAWITLDGNGPRALTVALNPPGWPSAVAARLPKALIHRNIPGEAVHRLLADLDAEWQAQAALTVFGTRQRLAVTAQGLRRRGWPVLDGPAMWRRGILTIAWRALESSGH